MDTFKCNEMAGQPGFFKPNGHKKKRRPYRHQMHDGIRVAVLRAFTAARLFLRGEFSSLAEAARSCGSTVAYVAAAITIIQSENTAIQKEVFHGQLSLLAVACRLRRLARLINAYRQTEGPDRAMFGHTIGLDVLFDDAIVPNL